MSLRTSFLLVALAAATLGTGCGGGTTPVFVPPDFSVVCTDPQVLCGNGCTSLLSDPKNCGSCGAACKDTEFCSGGACALFCPQGFKACGQSCINLTNDAANCGACGMACSMGQVCTAGKCALSCGPGQMVCGGLCVTTASDAANCGACGMACAQGEVCAAGKCTLRCPNGLTNCNGGCVNTSTDDANCGACGMACPMGQVCRVGTCNIECQNGLSLCSGVCVNRQSDNANCGACGMACPMGNVCSMGKCAVSCQVGLANCSGQCVNLQSDNANCGACGMACPMGNVCASSKCAVSCQVGLTNCAGQCVNLQTDNKNCGACAVACGPGTSCQAAKCVATCAAPLVTCNGMCVDPRFDPANCGMCGVACGMPANGTSTCLNSACKLFCNAGFGDCDVNPANGCELNLLADVNNCGACKRVCAQGQACTNGVCVAAAACQKNTTQVAISPNKDVMVCDDPNNVICEQDEKTICPIGWNLCTPKMLANRPFNFALPNTAVGEIYCRGANGANGAGHYTVNGNLNAPPVLNCNFGSSRPTCVTGYGCNEQTVSALCCQPNALCGNGKVDGPEEECDDGNADETDACLNSCSWRVPVDHGLAGPGC